MIRAKVTGTLAAESASIGSHLLMRDGRFSKSVNLIVAKIGGTLDLRRGALTGLDLTGARLDGELLLASDSQLATWGDDARLVLRNARVAALQDEPGAWPDRLDIDGFSYESFGGLGGDEGANIGSRGSGWFVDWLARDEPYTPQPYQQCADVLREMGHPDMADDVLYAGRERERGEFWQVNKLRWFGLSLLNWTIGYGYGRRYFRALWWVLGFVVLGTAVLLSFGDPKRVGGPIDRAAAGDWEAFRHVPAVAFYSLDVLLPVTHLHEPHYKIALDGAPKVLLRVPQAHGLRACLVPDRGIVGPDEVAAGRPASQSELPVEASLRRRSRLRQQARHHGLGRRRPAAEAANVPLRGRPGPGFCGCPRQARNRPALAPAWQTYCAGGSRKTSNSSCT